MWKHFFAGILASTIITRSFTIFIFIIFIFLGAADFPAARIENEITSNFLPGILISIPGSLLIGYVMARLEKQDAVTTKDKFVKVVYTIIFSSVWAIYVNCILFSEWLASWYL